MQEIPSSKRKILKDMIHALSKLQVSGQDTYLWDNGKGGKDQQQDSKDEKEPEETPTKTQSVPASDTSSQAMEDTKEEEEKSQGTEWPFS